MKQLLTKNLLKMFIRHLNEVDKNKNTMLAKNIVMWMITTFYSIHVSIQTPAVTAPKIHNTYF